MHYFILNGTITILMTYLPRPLSCQISSTVTAYEVVSTTAPISNHERAHHKTASTSLQIMSTMKSDRLTEERAGGGDK